MYGHRFVLVLASLITVVVMEVTAGTAEARTHCSRWDNPDRRINYLASWKTYSGSGVAYAWKVDHSVTIRMQWRSCHVHGQRHWEVRAGARKRRSTGSNSFALTIKHGPDPDIGPIASRVWRPRIQTGSTWWSPPVGVVEGYDVAWVEAHTHYARIYQGRRDYYASRAADIVRFPEREALIHDFEGLW